MRWPTLVRRREAWVLTPWGWIAVLIVIAGAIVFAARHLHSFLAQNEPLGARILVVEGWLDPEELDQAIATIRSQGYAHIITTGGPIESWPELRGFPTYAQRAAHYLTQRGIDRTRVTVVPAPASAQDRTFLSAVMVRDWASHSGIRLTSLDVFSAGTHARRSRLLYQLAFGPRVAIGIYAARDSGYDGTEWWRTAWGTRDVLEQAVGLLWVKLFFRPPVEGSRRELWG